MPDDERTFESNVYLVNGSRLRTRGADSDGKGTSPVPSNIQGQPADGAAGALEQPQYKGTSRDMILRLIQLMKDV